MAPASLNKTLLWSALLALLFVAPFTTGAQSLEDDHDGFTVGDRYFTCGSEWAAATDYEALLEATRLNHPEVYELMVARAKGIELPQLQGGCDHEFLVADRANPQGGFKTVCAKLRYADEDILIWVDMNDDPLIADSIIDMMVEGLTEKVPNTPHTVNPNKGVIYNDIDLFGNPPPNRTFEEQLVSFLLTDIEEPLELQNGVIGGYFNPYDQTSYPGSNKTNLLYIDSHDALLSRDEEDIPEAVQGLIGTMAHEFQHLINYGRYNGNSNDYATHWIYNEGLSEVASIRNGFLDRAARTFLASPNKVAFFDLPSGSGDVVLPGYERAMLWVYYLSERFGNDILYDLTAATGKELEPARKAAVKIEPGADIESIFSEFWVANYILDSPDFQGDRKYTYLYDDVPGRQVAVDYKSIPATAITETKELQGHAAILQSYLNFEPSVRKEIRIRFKENGQKYTVYAVPVNDKGEKEVLPLEVGQEYKFRQLGQVVFVIVNTSGTTNPVSWTIESGVDNGISGVEDMVASGERVRLHTIAPNPARNNISLSFTTGKPAEITLDLYDIQGRQIRQVLSGSYYEQGSHTIPVDISDLPGGVYQAWIRSSASDVPVTRQFVVVK